MGHYTQPRAYSSNGQTDSAHCHKKPGCLCNSTRQCPTYCLLHSLLKLLHQDQPPPLASAEPNPYSAFLASTKNGKENNVLPVRSILLKHPCQFPWVSTSLLDKQCQACLSPRGVKMTTAATLAPTIHFPHSSQSDASNVVNQVNNCGTVQRSLLPRLMTCVFNP